MSTPRACGVCGRLSSKEAVDGRDLIETRLPAELAAARAGPPLPPGAAASNAMRVRWPRGDSTSTTATRVKAKVRPTAAT